MLVPVRGTLDTLQAAFVKNYAADAADSLWTRDFVWDRLLPEIKLRGQAQFCGFEYQLSEYMIPDGDQLALPL